MAMFVHWIGAVFVIDPPVGAPNVPCCRTVLPAGFAVPAAPGSPVCSLTKRPAGGSQGVPPRKWSRMLFAIVVESPVAMSSPSGKRMKDGVGKLNQGEEKGELNFCSFVLLTP